MNRLISGVILAGLLAMSFAGCGTESTGNDLNSDATDVQSVDNGVDTLVPDVGQDDVTVEDVVNPDVEDAADVQTGDMITDANLDQCHVDEECDACMICTELQGYKQCVATPEAGMKECYSNDDCVSGVCHPDKAGKMECGGSCGDFASYNLHEWGVNVVTPDGATMQAGPYKYYGAIAAKPVIYIYSDYQFTLDVSVDFNSGVSTETWPLIPNSEHVVWDGIEVGTISCTTTATPQPDMSGMAEIESLEIYDLPEWVVDGANCLTYGDTVSKLLFYTGPFQNYVPPLESEATIDTVSNKASFAITNNYDRNIGPVIALYRYAESTCVDPSYCPVHTADVAVTIINRVDAQSSKTVETELFRLHKEVTQEDPYPSIDPLLPQAWQDLSVTLGTLLSDAGLSGAEVAVFLEAWSTTFFGVLGDEADFYFPSYNDGAFLIYLWPTDMVEEMLPMTLVPEPAVKSRAIVEYQHIAPASAPL